MTHSLLTVSSSLLFIVSLGGLGCGQANPGGVHDGGAGEAGAPDARDAPVSGPPARLGVQPSAEGGARALPVLPSADAGGSTIGGSGPAGSDPSPSGTEPVAPEADLPPPAEPLPEISEPSSTLRELSQTLTAVPALTGVVSRPSDGRRYGFLTFDVDQLPANIRQIERAVAHTGPYVVGDPIPVYHVAFDELAPSALDVDDHELQLLTILPRGTSGALLIPTAIVDLLSPDYLTRSASHHYSQFRFDLPATTSDADAAAVAGLLAAAALDLDYLVP